MNGYGFHWSPCNKGGGLGGIGVLIIVLILWAAYGHAAEDAAIDVLHVLEITGLALAGAGVLAGAVFAGLAIRERRRPALPVAQPARGSLPEQWQATALAARQRAAAEDRSEPRAIAPHQELHIHLHGSVPAETVAAVREALSGKGARS